jgi:hypothetical protein
LTHANSNIRRRGGTQSQAEESFMTSKEEAELLFKQEPLFGGPRSSPEYEQRARAERTKIARLRVLRLAREQRRRRRNARRKSHQELCGAARALKSNDSHIARAAV